MLLLLAPFTDMETTAFPEYIDPFEEDTMAPVQFEDRLAPNKLIDQIIRTPGRVPSPQPTHLAVGSNNGNGNGHRVLRSATVGYVAPKFEGKKEQMDEGV
jgi:glutamate dehydrogenase